MWFLERLCTIPINICPFILVECTENGICWRAYLSRVVPCGVTERQTFAYRSFANAPKIEADLMRYKVTFNLFVHKFSCYTFWSVLSSDTTFPSWCVSLLLALPFLWYLARVSGRNIIVGVGTCYGLHNSGFEPRWGKKIFSGWEVALSTPPPNLGIYLARVSGRNIIVGVVTCYGLHNSGFEPRRGEKIFSAREVALSTPSPPI